MIGGSVPSGTNAVLGYGVGGEVLLGREQHLQVRQPPVDAEDLRPALIAEPAGDDTAVPDRRIAPLPADEYRAGGAGLRVESEGAAYGISLSQYGTKSAGSFSTVNAAALLHDAAGVIAIGGACRTPVVFQFGESPEEACRDAYADPVASAEYRRAMAGVFTRRVVELAHSRPSAAVKA